MSKELVMCSNCNGAGVTSHSELTCYHKGEYDEWHEDCSRCDGTGMMWKITEIRYEKYVKPKVDNERRKGR